MTYAIWKPEHDGHAPPNWREGMKWTLEDLPHAYNTYGRPDWSETEVYRVSPEALNSPNDDARQEALKELTRLGQEADALDAISLVRKLPADFLAKHGITLAPEKDVFVELWADLMVTIGQPHTADELRSMAEGDVKKHYTPAIELLRTRFEQMKGEG